MSALEMMETTYTVQEAAERTGLSAHTLRYYEREELLPTVNRESSSGHRRYTERDITFIEFLKRLRATGVSICQMREYAALVRQGDGTLEERREILEAHATAVRRQIEELQTSLGIIEWKIENYRRLGLERATDVECELVRIPGETNNGTA